MTTCAHCGTEFVQPPRAVKGGKPRKYCSDRCRIAVSNNNLNARRRAATAERKAARQAAKQQLRAQHKACLAKVEEVEDEPEEKPRKPEHKNGICRVCGEKARAPYLTYCERCYVPDFAQYRPAWSRARVTG